MSDLHEDDLSRYVEQGGPTESVEVEASGRVQVADAEADDIDALFHAGKPRKGRQSRLERIGHRPYLEVPLAGPFSCWWQRIAARPDIRILPDNCADFIVASDGRSWLVGPASTAEIAELPAGIELRGLRISAGAVGAVTRHPAHELSDAHVDIADLIGSHQASRLVELVWAGPPSRGDLAEWWPTAKPRALSLVRALITDPARTTLALADQAGISDRHLRRLVLDDAGLTPKTLQKVARLQLFLRKARSLTIAAAAVDAGYADQPHLNRDVRRLTGLTPRNLLLERAA